MLTTNPNFLSVGFQILAIARTAHFYMQIICLFYCSKRAHFTLFCRGKQTYGKELTSVSWWPHRIEHEGKSEGNLIWVPEHETTSVVVALSNCISVVSHEIPCKHCFRKGGKSYMFAALKSHFLRQEFDDGVILWLMWVSWTGSYQKDSVSESQDCRVLRGLEYDEWYVPVNSFCLLSVTEIYVRNQ